MEALKTIQQIGRGQNIQNIRISDLKLGHPYPIKEFKTLITKKGKRVVVIILDKKDECQVFLPDRFSEKLEKKLIKTLNLQKLSLVYNGLKDIKEGKKFHDIDFQEIKQDNEIDSN